MALHLGILKTDITLGSQRFLCSSIFYYRLRIGIG
jgi:hypothetical protein